MSRYCGFILPIGVRCGGAEHDVFHDAKCRYTTCDLPSYHHPFTPKEEPMPEAKTPTVHLATVVSTWEPDYSDNRENGSQPSVTVRLDRYTKLPRIGDRIVVSSATEGIFAWIREQTQAREDVLAAAIAWYDECVRNNFDGDDRHSRALYQAVQRAKKGDTIRKPDPDDSWRFPDKAEALRVATKAMDSLMADAAAPSEDPREALGRRVAEAIGGTDREITVIIVGDI